jgi:DNA-directed RNA polymerase specialized sigma24 family protein
MLRFMFGLHSVAATINSELDSRVDQAINKLHEDVRVAVMLRDDQSLSNQEAADTLEVPVSTLKVRLHRGSITLRFSVESCVAEHSKAD